MKQRMIITLFIFSLLLGLTLWGLPHQWPVVLAAAGSWVGKTGMNTGRLGAGNGVINGLLYVAGGDKSSLDFTAALEVYDPASDKWVTKKDMPTARRFFGTAVINGKLYTVGGGRQFGTYYNNLEIYDPATDSWDTTKKPMPTARHDVGAAAINGKLYVVGGNDASFHYPRLEVYDPATDTWDTTKKPMPTARSGAVAVAIAGKLYVIGGAVSAFPASIFLNTLEVYDPATDTWESKTGMPTARAGIAAVAIDGKLYVVGGTNDANQGTPLSTLEIYDPATDKWKSDTGMPTARKDLTAAVISGKLYAAGGTSRFGSAHTLLEVYTPPPPNADPTITATDVTIRAGSPASIVPIAAVNDTESGAGGVTVTVTSTNPSNGITISDIVNANGMVKASILAACGAGNASFTLTATDGDSGTKTATLNVKVDPNTPPTLDYPSNPGTSYGTAITIAPTATLSDNGSVDSVTVASVSPSNPGGITVDSAGMVSVANTVPAGNYTVTIRAVDNCGGNGGTKDASFTLGIARVTPVITWNPPAFLPSGPLSSSVLNATANVGGSFSYTPSAGTVLAAGSVLLTADFTPSDTINYNSPSQSVTLPVLDSSCSTIVNPATLPQATRGTPFAQTLSASPTGSYTFSLLSGSLPPGLSIVNVLGIYSLRGTPTTAGTYSFTIKAKKNNSTCEGARTYTIVVP